MNSDSTLQFDLVSPARLVFGWGRRAELPKFAQTLGNRAFLVTGSRTLERNGTFSELSAALRSAGLAVVEAASVEREPTIVDVDRAAERVRQFDPKAGDFVVGIGGGSAIDLAKAVAALATNRQGENVLDFLEGVGRGLKVESPPLPVLAVPTTAGTGSEATKNSVISSADPPFKKSLRSDLMVPRIALVDPQLAISLPPHVTAYTGMDAITQLIESYISKRWQPIPRALAESGLKRALPSIVQAVKDGSQRAPREGMAYAAALSGVALANSGLGLAHGVAAALGAVCGVPHGLACAVMLPAALRVNREVREQELAELWSVIEPRDSSPASVRADRFVERVESLCRQLDIPTRLSAIGVTAEQIPALAEGSRGSSMDGNPRAVGNDELMELLHGML